MYSRNSYCNWTRSFCRPTVALITTLVIASITLVGCSKSASDQLRAGQVHLEKGDLAAAQIDFKNAVLADPKLLAARLSLADVLERSGDLQGAEQQYRRALDLGGDADALVPRIAVLVLDRSENTQLITDFAKRQLKSSQANSDLRALVALAHLGLGQQKAAMEQISLAKEPTAGIHLANAQLALLLKQRAAAATELEAVLKDSKAPWWVLRGASRIYASAGDYTKALAAMKQAYDALPNHQGLIGEYGEQLVLAKHTAEARPLLTKLRKVAPGYYRTQYLGALILMEDGKQDEAYTAVAKVLAKLPEHMQSQIIAATVEFNRNELASVASRVAKILAAEPNSIEGYRLRANLELKRGDRAAAAATLNKVLMIAPQDRGFLAMAAELAWLRGERVPAILQLQRAAQQMPQRPQFLARLAEMLQAVGKQKEARSALDRAAEIAQDAPGREFVFNAMIRLRLFDQAKTFAQREIGLRPRDPEPLLWMAVALGSEGNEPAALVQTRQALDLRPDFFPALLAMKMSANTPERTAEYSTRLQKAVESRSRDPRVYLERAQWLYAEKSSPEKIGEVLDKGVAAIPADLALREAAIRHWLKSERKDKALAQAKEGEAAMPDNVAMTALAASVQEIAGETSQAAIKYAQLAGRFPDRVDWNIKHAEYQARNGKKNEAIATLRKLIQLRSAEPAPYQFMAMLQLEQNLPKEAQVTAELLRDQPKMREAGWLLLGDVYARTRRTAEALKAYQAADPAGKSEAALVRKVTLLDSSGEGVLAGDEVAKWLAAQPNNLAGLTLAARRESARSNYLAAAKHLETIVRLDPTNTAAHNDLAWAYVMAHDPRALAAANKAIEQAPQNALVLDTLSQAQLNAGQKIEAMATLRRALAADSKTAIPRVHLAELLVDAGNKKEATALLTQLDENKLDREAKNRLKLLREKL